MTGPAAPPRPPRPPTNPPPPPRKRAPRERWSFGRWLRYSARNALLFAIGVTTLLVVIRVAAVAAGGGEPVATAADSAVVAHDSAAAASDTAGLYRHAPAVVRAPALSKLPVPIASLPPVRLPVRPKKLTALLRTPQDRARGGERVTVLVTQYCLRGLTRLDHEVREGIVAADPRYFPLGRDLELSVAGIKGRFRIDDTGRLIKGLHLDMWTSDCPQARRWGRKFGTAQLVDR